MFRRMLLLLIGLALTACEIPGVGGAQATLAPTTLSPTKTSVLTLTLTPSATASPAPSAAPTLTPFPTLSGEKPYLIVRHVAGDDRLFVYDQDGQGRQTFQLPQGDHYYSSFSPNGKWYAFYSGSLGRGEQQGSLPLALNILNTRDGTVHKVANVVTDGYLEKLSDVTAQLKALYPDRYKPNEDGDWAEGSITSAFMERIYSRAWSPNSHALAFAGQMQGISSDVYVYDVISGSIQRLNDDLESVWSIQWSPDGKKILFANAQPGNIYVSSTLHMLKPGNKVITNPEIIFSSWFMGGGGWLSPNLLLVGQGSDTGGDSRLQTLNVNTAQLSGYLWEDNYGRYAVDPKRRTILISTGEFSDPKNLGLYLLTSDGGRRKVFSGLYLLNMLTFRGGEKHRFLISGFSDENVQYNLDGNIVGITADNKPTLLGKLDYEHIHISPDYAWMVIYDEQHLYLYDKNDEVVKTFSIPAIEEILWRPDSQGIAYVAGSKLYFLSIPDGEPRQIDDCGGECALDLKKAVWLP